MGLISASYVVLKAQTDIASGVLRFDTKPTSVDGCTYTYLNVTTERQVKIDFVGEVPNKGIEHISYLYYTPFGAIVTIVVSLCCAAIFGMQNPNEVEPSLLAPFMRKLVKSDSKPYLGSLPLSPTDVSVKTYNFEQEKT